MRAANDALSSFLQTKEKEEAFWKAVQNRALEFATEAVKETPDTLSDERSTTKQDSDAKYHRVVGASLSLVLNLLRKGDVSVLQDGLARYLEVEALWTVSKAEDPFVRRAFYQLLRALLATKPELLEPRLQQVGRTLVAEGLKTGQIGSATDLLKVLAALTSQFPQVWGTQKHALQRLQQFVAQGSQGGAEEYWLALDQLLRALPDKSPPAAAVATFLQSMRKGISSRLESRSSRHQAFQSYAQVFDLFLVHLPLTETFLEEHLSTLTRQYLHPNPESGVPAPQRPHFLTEAWTVVTSHPDTETRKAAAEEWQKLGASFLSHMSNSLPEVSEGYRKSQTAISSEGERWFALADNILSRKDDKYASLQALITPCSVEILRGALDLLSRRNFKPFGAAAVLQSAFRHCPRLCTDNDVLGLLFPLGQTEIYQTVVASPSLPYLVSGLDTASAEKDERFGEIWAALAEAALQITDHDSAISAIRILIAVPSVAAFAQKIASLQTFLVNGWKEYVNGAESPAVKDLCEGTLSFDTLTEESMNAVATDIISGFDAPETYRSAAAALELVLHKQPELIPANHDLHVRLVTKLLALTELSDSALADKAESLRLLLEQRSTSHHPVTRIIENHLHEAGPSSLEYVFLGLPVTPMELNR